MGRRGAVQVAVEGTFGDVTPELINAPIGARPGGHVKAKLAASLTQVPFARLGSLWPTPLSPGSKRWILANVHGGTLDEDVPRIVVGATQPLDIMLRSASAVTEAFGV